MDRVKRTSAKSARAQKVHFLARVRLITLVYERALRGYLNNRNSVHFQPEVHVVFSTLKKHNKTMLLRTGSYTKALITCFLVHFLIKSTRE